MAIVVIENIAKSVANGGLIRCAVAMGAKEVCTIGYDGYSKHGSRGSQRYIKLSHCYEWNDFFQYLEQQYNVYPMKIPRPIQNHQLSPISFCGVVLTHPLMEYARSTALPIYPLKEVTFHAPHCFVLLDYRRSMAKAEFSIPEIFQRYQEMCDYYVFVEIPNQSNDINLHDDAKVSIILQKYAMDQNLAPILFSEEKHVVNRQEIIERLKETYGKKPMRRVTNDSEDTLKSPAESNFPSMANLFKDMAEDNDDTTFPQSTESNSLL